MTSPRNISIDSADASGPTISGGSNAVSPVIQAEDRQRQPARQVQVGVGRCQCKVLA